MQHFDEPHRQFFELLALWFVRTVHRQTNRHFNPLRVTFTHARNSDLREVHHLLQCPVDFAQTADTWVLPQRVMDLPIISGDSRLLQILTAHADDLLAERHSVSALQSMVVNQLVDLLPSGEARAAAVAQRLGLSTRSFVRHLAEEGDDLQRNPGAAAAASGHRYLVDNRMSSQQIAWSLGYSDPSALTRNNAAASEKAPSGTAIIDPSSTNAHLLVRSDCVTTLGFGSTQVAKLKSGDTLLSTINNMSDLNRNRIDRRVPANASGAPSSFSRAPGVAETELLGHRRASRRLVRRRYRMVEGFVWRGSLAEAAQGLMQGVGSS